MQETPFFVIIGKERRSLLQKMGRMAHKVFYGIHSIHFWGMEG